MPRNDTGAVDTGRKVWRLVPSSLLGRILLPLSTPIFMVSPSMNFIGVTVERSEAGLSVTVEGSDGRALALPAPEYLESWAGKRVVLGIRPQ